MQLGRGRCSECFEIKIYICTILFRNGNLKLHLITMLLIVMIFLAKREKKREALKDKDSKGG